MSISCPYCNRQYDATLFGFEKTVRCECGHAVKLQHTKLSDTSVHALRSEQQRIDEIKRCADKIAFLIVSTEYPAIDIEIEKQHLRERIESLFPDKAHLYGLIYEPRFRRLEEQFRLE